MDKENELGSIAKLFFKLGSIAFGGPAAHIAMMEDEVVRKRKWMDHAHFLDLVGATNLIPGPNSTEMTMHCGHERAGWKGLLVAGAAFILPAVVITSVIAWLYQQYGQLPQVEKFIYGIKPAVIAIILSAVITLGRKAVKTRWLAFLGIATLVVTLLGVNEIVALFGCGLAGWLFYVLGSLRDRTNGFAPVVFFPTLAAITSVSNLKIFLIFLKIGALLYGTGYVLFAFLDAELVSRGWLTRAQLMDAVAVGQLTPGPLLSTATFIGWQMNGLAGAMLATLGVFLPSFLFVWWLNPLIPKMRKSKQLYAFLDAVNVASVAVILSVAVEMGRETFLDWRMILIAGAGLAVTFLWKKLSSAYVVFGGALAGYLLSLI